METCFVSSHFFRTVQEWKHQIGYTPWRLWIAIGDQMEVSVWASANHGCPTLDCSSIQWSHRGQTFSQGSRRQAHELLEELTQESKHHRMWNCTRPLHYNSLLRLEEARAVPWLDPDDQNYPSGASASKTNSLDTFNIRGSIAPLPFEAPLSFRLPFCLVAARPKRVGKMPDVCLSSLDIFYLYIRKRWANTYALVEQSRSSSQAHHWATCYVSHALSLDRHVYQRY